MISLVIRTEQFDKEIHEREEVNGENTSGKSFMRKRNEKKSFFVFIIHFLIHF